MKEVKAKLTQVRRSIKREKRLIDQIILLEARVTSVTRALTGMPRGGAAYTLADYVADLEPLTQQLMEELQAERLIYKEALELLALLDGQAQDIMVDHYLNLKTWDEIAEKYNLSYSGVQKIHQKSLEKIKKCM